MTTKTGEQIKLNEHMYKIQAARNAIQGQLDSAGFIIENPSVQQNLIKAIEHMNSAMKRLNEVYMEFSEEMTVKIVLHNKVNAEDNVM